MVSDKDDPAETSEEETGLFVLGDSQVGGGQFVEESVADSIGDDLSAAEGVQFELEGTLEH